MKTFLFGLIAAFVMTAAPAADIADNGPFNAALLAQMNHAEDGIWVLVVDTGSEKFAFGPYFSEGACLGSPVARQPAVIRGTCWRKTLVIDPVTGQPYWGAP